MKRWQSLAVPLCALWLVACGGSDDAPAPPKAPKVPELASSAAASGNWRVAVEQGDDVQVGRYWAADSGQRVLLLTDANGKMRTVLVRKDSSADWELGAGVEPQGQVQFATTVDESAAAGQMLALADVQSSNGYELRGAEGRAVYFTVNAEGQAQPSVDAACQWTGQLETSDLPQTLAIRVQDAAGCWGGGAAWTGLLVRDAQDAPAAFRAISIDGSSPAVDAWVFTR